MPETDTKARFAKLSADISFPLYLQVEATLKEMIEDTVYSPGEQIPSERELSEQLGVSRMTVRRAIENLIEHGLLERRSTNGTYVRQPSVLRGMGKGNTMGLTQLLKQEGTIAGSQLIDFEIKRAPLKIAEKLDLRLGSQVVDIKRLRMVNGQPFCVETCYLPFDKVPGLQAGDFAEPDTSLYAILQERYGIVLDNSDETLKISFATHDEAELLEIKEGDPVLLLRGIVRDSKGEAVEYLKSVNHPEKVVFHTMTKL